MPRRTRKPSPKRKGRPRKTSPKRKSSPRRKRRLNPPRSLSRLVARQVIDQGFEFRDINPSMRGDIVNEIHDEMNPLVMDTDMESGSHLVSEDDFRERVATFKNFREKQIQGRISDSNREIYQSNLSYFERARFNILWQEGFDELSSFEGARRYDINIDNMIRLKRAGISSKGAIILVTNLNDSQIENIIELLNLGTDLEDAYEIVTTFNRLRLNNALKLKREGFFSYPLLKDASYLPESTVETIIRLMREGVHEYTAFRSARILTPNQIETMLDLKREEDLDDEEAFEYAKNDMEED